MLQNAPDCTIQKKFSGKHAPKPPSKHVAMPRVASPPPKKKIVAPPPPPSQILHTPMKCECIE